MLKTCLEQLRCDKRESMEARESQLRSKRERTEAGTLSSMSELSEPQLVSCLVRDDWRRGVTMPCPVLRAKAERAGDEDAFLEWERVEERRGVPNDDERPGVPNVPPW